MELFAEMGSFTLRMQRQLDYRLEFMFILCRVFTHKLRSFLCHAYMKVVWTEPKYLLLPFFLLCSNTF